MISSSSTSKIVSQVCRSAAKRAWSSSSPRSAAAVTAAISTSDAANARITPADVQFGRQSGNTMDAQHMHHFLSQNEEVRNDLAYSLSFGSGESDVSRMLGAKTLPLDDRMQEQLRISQDQLRNYQSNNPAPWTRQPVDNQPLPRTLEDALRPSSRAIVITEAHAPFRICNVNPAWEKLCGYTFLESKDKTLGSLIQGPETDIGAATALIAQMLSGEQEAGITLTNYTKSNRRFRNRVRVGALVKDEGSDYVTHFVGVLQEVHDGM